jgi:O-antigen ligase
MLRGGTVSWSLWQLDRVVYLPLVFLLFQAGLRGPKDHAALARVLVSAAMLRACMALYVQNNFSLPPDPFTGDTRLPYATTHHDSILFADACVVIISLLFERAGGWAWRTALLTLPLLFAGMIANNRRLVWVEVAIVFLTTYLTTPPNPFKRKVKRAIMILSPALAVYISVGWESSSPAFKPVKMIRSVVDPETDSSTMWREFENYDLVYTIRQNPIFGTGYGHPFWEVITLPEINYTLELYCPHNSILGLWAFAGYFGFTAMTLFWVVGVYFGLRAYHASTRPIDRAAAMTSFGSVCVYLVHSFGDLGLGCFTGVFTVAPAIAVAGKLAVAAGEWGVKKLPPAPVNPEPSEPASVDLAGLGAQRAERPS